MKRTAFILMLLLAVGCSGSSKKSDPKKDNEKKAPVSDAASSKEKPPAPSEASALKPLNPDLAPQDLQQWTFKTREDALAKVRSCEGYKKLSSEFPDKISLLAVHNATEGRPYWAFAVSRREGDAENILNYCNVIAVGAEIRCDPGGSPVCP